MKENYHIELPSGASRSYESREAFLVELLAKVRAMVSFTENDLPAITLTIEKHYDGEAAIVKATIGHAHQ